MVKPPLHHKVLQAQTPWTRAKEVLREVGGRVQGYCSTGARREEAIPLQGTGMTEKFTVHSPT